MELFYGIDSAWALVFALLVGFVAGAIKGVVGFGMPTVLISGLGAIASAEVALAGLILPTLMTNSWQALRQGPRAALSSVRRFRVFLIVGGLVLLASAQLVPVVPERVLLLFIGLVVTGFVLSQLSRRSLRLDTGRNPGVEAGYGTLAGFCGGLTGIWGPPTVAMLTAMGTEKKEQIRVQGVVYGLGALALVAAHIASGVFRAETSALSVILIPTALMGMALGFAIQDRIEQSTFRKVTLWVLLIAGLNLIRRGLM